MAGITAIAGARILAGMRCLFGAGTACFGWTTLVVLHIEAALALVREALW